MRANFDQAMAEHAVGALLLWIDWAPQVMPVLRPLAMRGCERCKWVIEAVETLIECGEECEIVAMLRVLNGVPVAGFDRLTRFHAMALGGWLQQVVEHVPDEFLQDVRDALKGEVKE